jgi:hypothetical protein
MTSTALPHLRVDAGDEPRLIPLPGTVHHLGGGFTADVHLDNVSVARRHATLVRDGDRMVILDDGSADGTLVNGRRRDRQELHSGDVLRLGVVQLTYLGAA